MFCDNPESRSKGPGVSPGAEDSHPPCEPDMKSACQCFRAYARHRPEIVALWCFAIGVVVGWKLRR